MPKTKVFQRNILDGFELYDFYSIQLFFITLHVAMWERGGDRDDANARSSDSIFIGRNMLKSNITFVDSLLCQPKNIFIYIYNNTSQKENITSMGKKDFAQTKQCQEITSISLFSPHANAS